jgi:hypothetical protein
LIKDRKFYDAVVHLVARMKQATLGDSGCSYYKMCEFDYETKEYVLLNDQEAEFFKDEILWLMESHTRRGPHGDDEIDYVAGTFREDAENNVYCIDLHFKDHTYILAVSNETYNKIQREWR